MTITQLELENESLERTLKFARIKKQHIASLDRNRVLREELRKVQWESIVEASAAMFGTTAEEVIGRRRREHEVNARHVAIAVVRQLSCATTIEIGKFFGGRDHGSVIWASNSVKDKLETDEEFRFKYNAVMAITMEATQ